MSNRFTISLIFLMIATASSGAFAATDCESGDEKIFSGQFGEGVDLISKCSVNPSLDKATKFRALQMRAWAYSNLHKDSEAIADQEAAFKIKLPSEYREYINYSSYLRRVKRYQDSLDALRAAKKLDLANGSTSMMTQYNLGQTLYELGRYAEAINAFTKGIPLQPDYPFVYWRRGLAYEALKRPTEAKKKDFERVAQLFSSAKDKWSEEDLSDVRAKLRRYGIDKKYPI